MCLLKVFKRHWGWVYFIVTSSLRPFLKSIWNWLMYPLPMWQIKQISYSAFKVGRGQPSNKEPQEVKDLRAEIKELKITIAKSRKRKINEPSPNSEDTNLTFDIHEINIQIENPSHATEETSSIKITPACVAAVTDNKVNGFKIVHNKLWIHVQQHGQVWHILTMVWLTRVFSCISDELSKSVLNTHCFQISTGQWKMDRYRKYGSIWVFSLRPHDFGSSLLVNAHLQQNSRTPLKYWNMLWIDTVVNTSVQLSPITCTCASSVMYIIHSFPLNGII